MLLHFIGFNPHLLQNMGEMVILIIIAGRLRKYALFWKLQVRRLTIGLLFGGVSILSMLEAYRSPDGLLLDIKNIIIAYASLYGGLYSAVPALLLASVARIAIGGVAIEAGIGGLLTSALLGGIWRMFPRRGRLANWGYALLGTTLGAATLLWCFALPAATRHYIFNHATFSLLLFYTLATLGFHLLVRHEFKWGSVVAADPETGFLESRIYQDLMQGKTFTQSHYLLILFRIDAFKTMNEAYGFAYGDRMLRTVSEEMQQLYPQGTMLGRRSADEFLICIPTEQGLQEERNRLLDRFQKVLSMSHQLRPNQPPVQLTWRAGTVAMDGSGTFEDWMRRADVALEAACQSTGMNVTVHYDQDLSERSRHRSELKNDLSHALVNREFEVHYQPQFNIATGKIRGFEALLRWRHPSFGLISPEVFIPLAEETGWIVPIGYWVIEEACSTHERIMRHLPDSRMGINLSVVQLIDAHLPDWLADFLARTKLSANRIEFEVTESMLISSLEQARGQLLRLRQMGLQIGLDDFGTGYSSLAYLQKLPLHVVKLDRSFMADLLSTSDVQMMESVIHLVQKLRYEVVAEGVETEAQLNLLRAWGCDTAQGYLFSRPLPVDQLFAYLDRYATNDDITILEQITVR